MYKLSVIGNDLNLLISPIICQNRFFGKGYLVVVTDVRQSDSLTQLAKSTVHVSMSQGLQIDDLEMIGLAYGNLLLLSLNKESISNNYS